MLKKIAKKILKGIGVLIGLLLVAFLVLYLIYNKPIPKGKTGADADALVQKIYKAVNKEAWDSTNIVQWTFMGMHHFIWDRERHLVQVRWDNYKVLLNPDKLEGKVYKAGKEQPDDYASVKTAYSHFTNDAFWLNAYTQLENGNPQHKVVKLEDGSEGLLVTFLKGGVTPGDSYLWILDENGLPKAWQMWVSIIPIGGIEVTWQDWETLPTGAKVAMNHDAGLANVAITNIRSYQTWEEGGIKEDIFASIAD